MPTLEQLTKYLPTVATGLAGAPWLVALLASLAILFAFHGPAIWRAWGTERIAAAKRKQKRKQLRR